MSTAVDLEITSPAAARKARRTAPVSRSVDRRSSDGAVLGTVALDPATFGIEPNHAVLHQVVTAQLAAARAGTQSTKTRAEVRGGGVKPWNQKGTGRARAGSSRSPVWVGGGVALGPKPRSYAQRTPKKMVQLALRSALSDRAALEQVAVVDRWAFDVPSTKAAVASLAALELEGRILVVITEDDWVADRSFANLPHVQVLLAGELNAHDVLVNDWVVFTDESLPGTTVEAIEVDIAVIENEDGEVVAVVESEIDVIEDAEGQILEVVETETVMVSEEVAEALDAAEAAESETEGSEA